MGGIPSGKGPPVDIAFNACFVHRYDYALYGSGGERLV